MPISRVLCHFFLSCRRKIYDRMDFCGVLFLCCPDILPSNIWCGWKERLRIRQPTDSVYDRQIQAFTAVYDRGICGRLLNLCLEISVTGMELVKWILYLPVNLFYLAGTGMMPADVPISDTVQTSYIMGGACGISVRCLWLCRS